MIDHLETGVSLGNALAVIMLQPELATLIFRLDPKAYQQAASALKAAGYPTIAIPPPPPGDDPSRSPRYRPGTYRG